MYRRQLTELEMNYGPLFMVWHDGANGGDGYYGGAREVRKIDRSTYYGWDTTWGITRRLQPGAVIFGDVGPDVRWVGNEAGHAGETYWATYTLLAPGPGAPANGYVQSDLATSGTRNGKYWMGAECDVPLRPGWFYHASQDSLVKTPSQLMDLYFASVGRGACLDLGLAPNKQGRLAAADVESLRVFGERLRRTFAVNFAAQAHIRASNVRGSDTTDYGPRLLVDGDRYSYWATDDSVTTPTLMLRFDHPVTFDVIRLRENIKLGQRVDSFEVNIVSGEDGGLAGQPRRYWLIKGTSIGPNKLIRLKEPVTADKVVLRITGSPVCVALSDFGLFKEAK
jgi:alpha-L-fucosidase